MGIYYSGVAGIGAVLNFSSLRAPMINVPSCQHISSLSNEERKQLTFCPTCGVRVGMNKQRDWKNDIVSDLVGAFYEFSFPKDYHFIDLTDDENYFVGFGLTVDRHETETRDSIPTFDEVRVKVQDIFKEINETLEGKIPQSMIDGIEIKFICAMPGS